MNNDILYKMFFYISNKSPLRNVFLSMNIVVIYDSRYFEFLIFTRGPCSFYLLPYLWRGGY